MSTEPSSQTTTGTAPDDVGNRLLYVLAFGSILVPFVCIPYIPIRRHLLGLKRSVHSLSDNTNLFQRELSNTLVTAQLRKEETLKLSAQLHELREQLHAITKRAAGYESARIKSERDVAVQLRAASDRAAEAETARLKSEEALRRQIDVLKRRADRERISRDVLQDVSASLGDTAAFIEEVEIQLGWSHSIPRDRGVDRMRQLALKLHKMAQTKQHTNEPDP